jgi:enoyl-CoA hydratase/carnithine racemase
MFICRRSFGRDDKFLPMSAFRGSVSPTRSWNHFRFGVEDGVATITFDRPQKLNALTFQVYADLRDLLTDLPQQDEVRVLVITGTGRGFSSGGDVNEIIAELQTMDPRDLLAFTRMTGTVTQRMRDCPIPIIASVNGVAAGAGAVIALAADLRLLAASASFAFLFTKVGLSGGDMGAAYLLPRLIGLGRATELLLLGESVNAQRALAIGLANAVVEDAELAAETSAVARRLAAGPALAYAATKMLISKQTDMNLGGAVELDGMTQALLMKSADHAEFYAAFREGRDPTWTGR